MLDKDKGRPFKSLDLKPYLWLNAGDSETLHKIYLKASLEHHPDRVSKNAEKDQRQAAEEKYSIINADYKDLKNSERLTERVVNEQLNGGSKIPESKNNLPPDLALEYFEVLEDPSPELVKNFRAKVQTQWQEIQKKEVEILQRFPYAGTGPSDSMPWTEEDLIKLKDLLAQKKYMTNILSELERKS